MRDYMTVEQGIKLVDACNNVLKAVQAQGAHILRLQDQVLRAYARLAALEAVVAQR